LAGKTKPYALISDAERAVSEDVGVGLGPAAGFAAQAERVTATSAEIGIRLNAYSQETSVAA
jgi:hypothetical protein